MEAKGERTGRNQQIVCDTVMLAIFHSIHLEENRIVTQKARKRAMVSVKDDVARKHRNASQDRLSLSSELERRNREYQDQNLRRMDLVRNIREMQSRIPPFTI